MDELTDTDLLDFLEACNEIKTYTGRVCFRWSTTGRGWRLHETSLPDAKNTVREAIRDAIYSARTK